MSAKISIRKTSLVDYPGCISTVLFFSGCNLRCPWCQNRELVLGEAKDLVGLEEVLAHIEKRRSVLGGVVLSGGEPCLWEELPGYIAEIKKIKGPDESRPIPVKLDTNGTFPAMLEKLFSNEETRPDYIALDLKMAPPRYAELLPVNSCAFNPGEALIQSAALIRESGITHEYRTLALPPVPVSSVQGPEGFITEKDIEALAPLADDSPWYFRPFRGGNCLDPAWDKLEESASEAHARAEALAEKARELGKNGLCYSS